VGAFVASGAGKKIGDKDRSDEPGKYHDFDRTRRAAHEQVGRERCKRYDTAKQSRSDEDAMACRGQRILPCRGMHQRLNIHANRREEAQDPNRTSGFADALPIFLMPRSCQTPLKRTLRVGALPAWHRGRCRFGQRSIWDSPIMVNGSLPTNCQQSQPIATTPQACRREGDAPTATAPAWAATRVFAQILAKFYFFDLLENLRIILLDYAQKRPDTANVPFKGAC
jgi:hypothetical protein